MVLVEESLLIYQFRFKSSNICCNKLLSRLVSFQKTIPGPKSYGKENKNWILETSFIGEKKAARWVVSIVSFLYHYLIENDSQFDLRIFSDSG